MSKIDPIGRVELDGHEITQTGIAALVMALNETMDGSFTEKFNKHFLAQNNEAVQRKADRATEINKSGLILITEFERAVREHHYAVTVCSPEIETFEHNYRNALDNLTNYIKAL